jgi:hypothetical protein
MNCYLRLLCTHLRRVPDEDTVPAGNCADEDNNPLGNCAVICADTDTTPPPNAAVGILPLRINCPGNRVLAMYYPSIGGSELVTSPDSVSVSTMLSVSGGISVGGVVLVINVLTCISN